jgi:hypothetical protein
MRIAADRILLKGAEVALDVFARDNKIKKKCERERKEREARGRRGKKWTTGV